MNQNWLYYRRRTPRLTVVLGLVLMVGSQALADVVGRLQFTVKNADDEKPISGASIVITDPTNVRPPVTLKTDASGTVTTDPLLNHAWSIKTTADGYQIDTRSVRVIQDVTTPVEIDMEPVTEKVIKVSGSVNVTRPSNAGQGTVRDIDQIQKLPVTPGNSQSLGNVLQTTRESRGTRSASSIQRANIRRPRSTSTDFSCRALFREGSARSSAPRRLRASRCTRVGTPLNMAVRRRRSSMSSFDPGLSSRSSPIT